MVVSVKEHDISRRAEKFGKFLLKGCVGYPMMADLINCYAIESVVNAQVMMSRGRILHLSTIDNGELIGMLSVRDMFIV